MEQQVCTSTTSGRKKLDCPFNLPLEGKEMEQQVCTSTTSGRKKLDCPFNLPPEGKEMEQQVGTSTTSGRKKFDCPFNLTPEGETDGAVGVHQHHQRQKEVGTTVEYHIHLHPHFNILKFTRIFYTDFNIERSCLKISSFHSLAFTSFGNSVAVSQKVSLDI